MDSAVIVVTNGLVDGFHKFTHRLKSLKLKAEISFEIVVEGLLVSILPGGSFGTHADFNSPAGH